MEFFKSFWKFRHFVITSIKMDFGTRFARSKLGAFWFVLNPLIQVLMYSIVLSSVLSSRISGSPGKFAYAVYLLSGMLLWSLFTDIIQRSSTLFIENGNLIKKIVFPKFSLPFVVLGISGLNNIILFLVTLLFLLLTKQPVGVEILLYFPLMILTAFTAAGIGLIVGIINVFIRDISQLLPIALQLGFWFTPIVYPVSVVPERYKFLLQFNPLFHLVQMYHAVFFHHSRPEYSSFTMPLGVCALLLIFSCTLYYRATPDIVDSL